MKLQLEYEHEYFIFKEKEQKHFKNTVLGGIVQFFFHFHYNLRNVAKQSDCFCMAKTKRPEKEK